MDKNNNAFRDGEPAEVPSEGEPVDDETLTSSTIYTTSYVTSTRQSTSHATSIHTATMSVNTLPNAAGLILQRGTVPISLTSYRNSAFLAGYPFCRLQFQLVITFYL